MPISLLWEAFHTTSFLINRMPTSVLNNLSPYQKLHHKILNYDFLRIFGCACYPLFRPYNQHKLDFHSKKCLFIGYSPLYKGYQCLDKIGKFCIVIHLPSMSLTFLTLNYFLPLHHLLSQCQYAHHKYVFFMILAQQNHLQQHL